MAASPLDGRRHHQLNRNTPRQHYPNQYHPPQGFSQPHPDQLARGQPHWQQGSSPARQSSLPLSAGPSPGPGSAPLYVDSARAQYGSPAEQRKMPLFHLASQDPIEHGSPSRLQPGASAAIGAIGDGRRTAPSTPFADKGNWADANSTLFGSVGDKSASSEDPAAQMGNLPAGDSGWDPLAQLGSASPALGSGASSSLTPGGNLFRSVTPSASDDGKSQVAQVKSRPSSFILDVLPAARDRANSPQPPTPRTTSSSSDSSAILAQSSVTTLPRSNSSVGELLTPSSSGFFSHPGQVLSLSDARCESPAPLESSHSLAIDAVAARVAAAEAGLAELKLIVKDEMASLKAELAALRGIVLQSSLATANPAPHTALPSAPANNGGGHAMGPRFAAAAVTDSPIVTLHSASPGHSPSLGPSPAQEHISSLEAQVAALTTAVSLLMNANQHQQHQQAHPQNQLIQPTGTPLASPGLGLGLPGFGRHGSLPPLSPSLGLGMSTPGSMPSGQRSPLMRPHSNSGASRQMSASAGPSSGPYSRQGSGNFDGPGGWSDSPAPSANPPGSLASKWEALGVGKEVFNSIAKFGIGPPSKMLAKAVPCILRGQDVVSQATSIQERIQSYVVPAMQIILNTAREEPGLLKGLQVIILTATVDQSAQAQRMASALGSPLGIRTALCTGNDTSSTRDALVNQPTQILIGTPRGLLELLRPGLVNLSDVRLLAIDECDQLVARNLSEQVQQLANSLPPAAPSTTGNGSSTLGLPPSSPLPGGPPSPSLLPGAFGTPSFSPAPRFGSGSAAAGRQTSIVSCTVPQDVLSFAQNLPLREPVRVLARREGGAGANDGSSSGPSFSARGIKQFHYHAPQPPPGAPAASNRERKLASMVDLVEEWPVHAGGAGQDGGCIVFCSSIDSVEAACTRLAQRNIEPLALVRDLGTAARAQLLEAFSSKRRGPSPAARRVLVVYDPLARGLAAELAQPAALVVNVDLPRVAEDYAHRFSCAAANAGGGGLLGRQGAGTVVNVVGQAQEMELLKQIEQLHRCRINDLPANFAILAQA